MWLPLLLNFGLYLLVGGRFRAQDGREMAWTFFLVVTLGLPVFCLFRVVVRRLAFWSRVPSYGAAAVGVVLTLVFLIGLAHLIPKRIGMGCLPMGLLGGIAGALEAKDRREAYRHRTWNAGEGLA